MRIQSGCRSYFGRRRIFAFVFFLHTYVFIRTRGCTTTIKYECRVEPRVVRSPFTLVNYPNAPHSTYTKTSGVCRSSNIIITIFAAYRSIFFTRTFYVYMSISATVLRTRTFPRSRSQRNVNRTPPCDRSERMIYYRTHYALVVP